MKIPAKTAGWKNPEVLKAGRVKDPGNAALYETGGWRTLIPNFNPENCINCMFCWMYCPDCSIVLQEGKVVGIDLAHCKGCGICAQECPGKKGEKALTMSIEKKA